MLVLLALRAGSSWPARRPAPARALARLAASVARCSPPTGAAELPALAWTALKVGALSYGGGFVIIPLMQGDAVDATAG